MKFLKKLNRGMVLTVLLLIGVIIYLIIVESADAELKRQIGETAKSYVVDEMNCFTVDDKYIEDFSNIGTDEDVSEMAEKVGRDSLNRLSEYFENVNSGKYSELEYLIVSSIERQFRSGDFNKEAKIEFDNMSVRLNSDDTADVSIEIQCQFVSSTGKNQDDFLDYFSYCLRFKKIGDEWKISNHEVYGGER